MKNIKSIILSILAAIILIGGAIYIANGKPIDQADEISVKNVSVIDGKQIIELKAKGGYRPAHTLAKAGMPTILRLNTSGTVDCSSALRIPSLNISKNLPLSGVTDIDLGIQNAGTIAGTCGMGMYPFDIKFEEGV